MTIEYQKRYMLTATIPINTALSNAVDLNGCTLGAILIPSVWTSAAVTFRASHDGVTFYDVYSGGPGATDAVVEYGLANAAAVSRWYYLDYKYFLGAEWVMVRSGVTATPVNQAAARTIYLIARPVV